MNISRAKDGFIKLHYKIQDSDLWNDNNALVVFLRMIGYAHYQDDFTSIRFNGKQRYLKRGEFAASVSELASLVNLPVGTLRDVLARLETDKRISKQTSNRTTIFRICNYSKYQDVPTRSPASRATNNPANSPTSPTGGKQNIQNRKSIDTKVSSNKAKTPSTDIDEMFQVWTDIVGFEIVGQKQKNRYACSNLLKSRGKEALRQLISGVAKANEDKFAPRISDFAQLQQKQNELIRWGQSKSKNSKVGIV